MDTKKFLALVEKKKQEAQSKHAANSDWAKRLEQAAMGGDLHEEEGSSKKSKREKKKKEKRRHDKHKKQSRHHSRERKEQHQHPTDSDSDSDTDSKEDDVAGDAKRRRRLAGPLSPSASESVGESDKERQRKRRKKKRRSSTDSSASESSSDSDGGGDGGEKERGRRRRKEKERRKKRKSSEDRRSRDKTYSSDECRRKHRRHSSEIHPDSDNDVHSDKEVRAASGEGSQNAETMQRRSKSRTPELKLGERDLRHPSVQTGSSKLPPRPPRRESVTPEPRLADFGVASPPLAAAVTPGSTDQKPCVGQQISSGAAVPPTVQAELSDHLGAGSGGPGGQPPDLSGQQNSLDPTEAQRALEAEARQRALASLASKAVSKPGAV